MRMIRLSYSRKIQFASAIIGILIGGLIISNFHFTNELSGLLGGGRFLKIVPFELSLIVFFLSVVACCLAANMYRINRMVIEKREYLFIILLIIGLQTVGLIPGRIDPSDLLFGIFVIWWLITVLTTEKYKIVITPLFFINIALLLCAVLSFINGGIFTIFSMLPLVKAMVTSFLIVDIVRRKELVFFYLKTLFIVTVVSAMIGIFQEVLFLTTGIVMVQVEKKFLKLILQSTPFGTFLRVPAYTGMHLYLANYLVFCLFIALIMSVYLKTPMTRSQKFLFFMAVSLMSVALILTFSNSNMLGMAVSLLIFVFIKWRHRLIHILMVLLLVLIGTYYLGLWEKVYEHVMSDLQLSGDIGLRVELIRRGLEGFLYRHPWIGAGLGRGKVYTQDVMSWGVHNAFVRAADDIGFFGFLLFFCMFVYAFLRIVSALLTIKERRDKAVLILFLLGLISYTIDIQFQPDFHSYYNWILIGFLDAAVNVFQHEFRHRDEKIPIGRKQDGH